MEGLPNSPHPFKAIISAVLSTPKAATRAMISILSRDTSAK